MTRNEAISTHRNQRHGKVLACFPMQYPRELLTALNILAVEVWGPPDVTPTHEMARIQAYVCPIVRHSMEFLASKEASQLDGILFPHTCDSLQGLATVLTDFGPWDKPVFHFTHPKGPLDSPRRTFLRKEFQHLATQLEEWTGETLTLEKLRDAIALHNHLDSLRGTLLEPTGQTLGPLQYELLRRGEFQWPQTWLEEIQEALAGVSVDVSKEAKEGGPARLLVSGIVPEPQGIFEALRQAGAIPVADDYAAIGRRICHVENLPDDPFDALMARYEALPPCPTRGASVDRRIGWLLERARSAKAEAVLLHNITFCEPEMFDLPHIRRELAAQGLPVLYMETELGGELSGQLATRLEAFVEMVLDARRKG